MAQQAAKSKTRPNQQNVKIRSIPAIILTGAAICIAEPVRFIPATPANSSSIDGTPLPQAGAWKWLPHEGGKGILGTAGDPKRVGEELLIRAKGLEPGKHYEVFGYFWSDGMPSGGAAGAHRPVQFGLSLATLQAYDGPLPGNEGTWMVRPGSGAGKSFGYSAVIEEKDPLECVPPLRFKDGAATLIRARLGISRAGADGSLPVFLADYPYQNRPGRAMVEGIGIRPTDAVPDPAPGNSTALHLAVRMGDWITLKRELEAKRDPNATDEDGLTPLFHACAVANVAVVKLLLDSGARPDFPAQSASPLTAAAMAPSPQIVEMLLKAGAVVPPDHVVDWPGIRDRVPDPQLMHPAIAAIRAGSLPALKLLLGKAPQLDLETLVVPKEKFGANINPDIMVSPYLVADAISMGHWDLAAFLIDRGCSLTRPQDNNFPSAPEGTFMVRAVAMGGGDGLPVIEALRRRGVSAVAKFHNDMENTRKRSFSGTIFPWDALSAAVWVGNTGLVTRFLPEAKDVGPTYRQYLLTLAMHSENREVVALVNRQFPGIRLERWEAQSGAADSPAIRDETLRLFLPRTTPLPESKEAAKAGGHVLAVIPSPQAAGVGDLLSAMASGTEGWSVVDRQLVAAALAEGGMAKPWLGGEHSIAALGDRLAADVLVITDMLKGESFSLYRFEAVEVLTGLVIHREHFPADAFDPKKDLAPFLQRTGSSLDSAGRQKRRAAVAMLSFTSHGELPNRRALADTLAATVQREIDSTPGLIFMERSQSEHLIAEQALKGEGSVWASSHLVEGAVHPAEGGKVRVALRLQTLGKDGSSQNDTEATGDPRALGDLVVQAWRDLMAKSETAGATRPPGGEANRENASLEAARLLREAEWLGRVSSVTPGRLIGMVEAASALGAAPDKLIPPHLRLLGENARPLGTSPIEDGFLPASTYLVDRYAGALPDLQRLLEYASLYLDRCGPEKLVGHRFWLSDPYWLAIRQLSAARAALVDAAPLLAPEVIAEVEGFGNELDGFTKRYFEKVKPLAARRSGALWLYPADSLLDVAVLKRNPELLSGLADLMLACDNVMISMANYKTAVCRTTEGGTGEMQWLAPEQLLARHLAERLPARDTPDLLLKKAEIGCVLAAPADRPKAIRELIGARAALLRADPSAKIRFNFAKRLVARHTPSMLLSASLRERWDAQPIHGRAFVPTLYHSPRTAPDFIVRHNEYMTVMDRLGKCCILPLQQREASLKVMGSEKKYQELADDSLRAGDRDALRKLAGGAALFELVSGVAPTIAMDEHVGADPRKSLPQEAPAGNGQPRLLADLRDGTDSSPGIALQPLVDEVNRNVLWIWHLPFKDGIIPPKKGFGNYADVRPLPLRLRPWLLGVDCSSGAITQRVNLAKAPGLNSDADSETSPWYLREDWLASHTAQTKGEILTSVVWGTVPKENEKDKTMRAAVRINKQTGAMTALPKGTTVARDGFWQSGMTNPIVGMGDSFYFLREGRGLEKDLEGQIYQGHMLKTLCRLDPDGSVTELTMIGRKPELTPFDAVDRSPEAILRDGNKLFIHHDRTHCGYYDPAGKTFEILKPGTPQDPARVQKALNTSKFQELVNSIRIVHRKSDDRYLSIEHDRLLPGTIQCVGNGAKGSLRLSIDLPVPTDFQQRATFLMQSEGSTLWSSMPYAEYAKAKPFYPVVLTQTESDVVLALQFDPGFNWYPGGRMSRYLPFIWALSKDDLFARFDEAVASGG